MTDANLMDADCIHGVTWWECDECPQFGDKEPENVEGRIVTNANPILLDPNNPIIRLDEVEWTTKENVETFNE